MQVNNSRKNNHRISDTFLTKRIGLIFIFALVQFWVMGQNIGPRAITPAILQQIKTDVEKLIPAFKTTLIEKELTTEQISFSVDTFLIQQVLLRRMNIDYSTAGMNLSILEMTSSYDQLMNKYYTRLLKMLNQEDKTVLIRTQKAWLSFRDAESELIKTIAKDKYSGGGTIQSNIISSAYADLIVKRCIDIFKYYDNIVKSN